MDKHTEWIRLLPLQKWQAQCQDGADEMGCSVRYIMCDIMFKTWRSKRLFAGDVIDRRGRGGAGTCWLSLTKGRSLNFSDGC